MRKVFSEEELNAIAAFYNSASRQEAARLDGPIVAREVVKAADIWQRGIARDLAAEVGKAPRCAGAPIGGRRR